MANNYTLFSSMLNIETPDEREWAARELDNRYEAGDADFNFEFDAKGLWIYSEESGDIEHVALFVQDFLDEFHPDRCWWFSWANTCSKPRIDEFGGGACFVTANEIDWINGQTWAISKAAEHNAEVERRKKTPCVMNGNSSMVDPIEVKVILSEVGDDLVPLNRDLEIVTIDYTKEAMVNLLTKWVIALYGDQDARWKTVLHANRIFPWSIKVNKEGLSATIELH